TVRWKVASVTSTTTAASLTGPACAWSGACAGRARADRSAAPCRLMEGWLITVLLYAAGPGTTLPLAVVRLLIHRRGERDVGQGVDGAEHADRLLAVRGRHVEGDRHEVVGVGRPLDAGTLPDEQPDVATGLQRGALDGAGEGDLRDDHPDDDGAALGRLQRGDAPLARGVGLLDLTGDLRGGPQRGDTPCVAGAVRIRRYAPGLSDVRLGGGAQRADHLGVAGAERVLGEELGVAAVRVGEQLGVGRDGLLGGEAQPLGVRRQRGAAGLRVGGARRLHAGEQRRPVPELV